MGLTSALKFRNIIAVMEDTEISPASYYLLKNGRKFGTDSLGVVVIPAVYSDASPFRNGFATAIMGAKRICWEGGEFSKDNPCEHWGWDGGQTILIDKNNNILIDDFGPLAELDWYSLQIGDAPKDTSLTETFKGVNGKFYSFANFEKHFKNWFFETLLTDLNKYKFIINSYNTIVFWDDSLGWIFEDNKNFIDLNYEALISGLLEIKKDAAEFFIAIDGLNPFIYTSEEFDEYFDDCGNAKIWVYPVLQLVISHGVKAGFYQNHF